ncbi:RHOMBOID-like protein 1 isoform X1 [Cucurbita moschata]|uniref:RHOMBOID-like protein n=2 Tax=Cucurbita moschata TaxID=3662 RepID=A0A6J1F8W4_CUCMO|nr:RHOMBOID-like protein 1 isoform X1 [Cucurbita moschata]XP_022934846.1 RHOMBOID-like protein 1 isoform X1 [Cucurbita moschata]XP_022934847.1 RHOMBOID-like protein 1 isoform X1 [Cucurbita moschata]XP_022934848.1 RHOMBOID-like protein 1 isoform X1 [Cucurbita moschata]
MTRASMAEHHPSDIQIMVNSRQGTAIHPVEVDAQSLQASGSIAYREVKQFKKWISWLIPSFVIANIIMFIITMYVNNCPKNSVTCIARFLGRFSFQPLKENPLLGPSSLTLRSMGALEVNKVVHGDQLWRLVTCNWLHAGVFHLLANMLSLLVIGIRLEQEFGFIRIGLLYVISGFGGSLLSALFIQSNISVGASGALFGLLGGMLSELITNWTIYSNKVPALLTLLVIIAINLAVGILPHVDNFAHIGGFISGFLLGFVFLIRPQFGWVSRRYTSITNSSIPVEHKFKTYQCVLWIISVILLIAGFTVGLVLLRRGFDANRHCSWCHYLSCVPTSKWSCNSEPTYCLSHQVGNQLNLTCSSNGKSGTYILPNASNSEIQGLCSGLCN